MRIFLFVLSIISLLLAAHQFTLTEQTGQFKGALFLLLIGIQLLIAAALISQHREERAQSSSMEGDKEDHENAGAREVNTSREQGKKS